MVPKSMLTATLRTVSAVVSLKVVMSLVRTCSVGITRNLSTPRLILQHICVGLVKTYSEFWGGPPPIVIECER